jgi:4-hydroxybenzoate polyprenyltransferase
MQPVICVDLDGTLVRSDLMLENLLQALRSSPVKVVRALLRLGEGKAPFKRRLADIGGAFICVENLPFDPNVVDYLKRERAQGRHIELVSGSDQTLVDRVTAHLGLFDAGFGSDGRCNLTGATKAAFLRERHPEGYVYMGGGRADLAPWMAADEALCANSSAGLVKRIRSQGRKATVVSTRPSVLRAAIEGMRLHQWGKNVLLFTIFLLTLSDRTPTDFLLLVTAFVAFGLVASANYLFNDLLDIEADRLHAPKRNRPFASGNLAIATGVALGMAALVVGFGLGALIGFDFLIMLASYAVLTAAYSIALKSVPVLDVLVLGVLYCLRIQAGASAITVPVAPWLAVFSLLFFSSLAFAKRYVEMLRKAEENALDLAGRGYVNQDRPFVLGFGAASAVASMLVFLLYAFSGEAQALSRIEVAMTCLGAIIYWIMRIWLLAARGDLHDDPVLFALKDRFSYLMAGVVVSALVIDQWIL